ncbi:MAG: glycosyltransferase family 2 protein [Candidatus Uhrbacteria bacterium]|nr:glycosyltransferase family 2 protein [Patescibacteria group bacterium]
MEDYSYGKYRLFEMIPGLLIWTTFIGAIILSFIAPIVAIVFIIIFDLYWLFRVTYFIFYLTLSWRRYKVSTKKDWWADVEKLPNWQRLYHFVFLPTYQEDVSILERTIEAIERSAYPNDKIVIVLGGEEGDQEQFRKNAQQIYERFNNTFHRLIITEHPKGLPNEIPGKGSNMNWMGHQVKKIIDEKLHIPYENIVVSALDVDTNVHPQYFACLAFNWLTHPNPLRSSYQPLTLYSNNIWYATAPVRVAAFGNSFWLLTEMARPDRLWTFSSHSMPWQMLVDVGFWQKDIVSEDSRIFLQGLLHYKGAYEVTPLYIPVNLDAVTGKNYLDSLKALYKQQRRWAWGVEHTPFMIVEFLKDRLIPLKTKLKYTFNQLEGMYTWSTAPILIFVLGWLPLWVIRDSEATSALVQNAPFTLEWLMRLAMAGVLISAILGMTFLPRRPEKAKPHTWIIMVLQWALLPVTFVVFAAFPAVDAQTRLMLGKYLGFDVTKKISK